MELNLSDSLVFWHWFIAAGVLLIIEMLMPAFFFLWLAAAAAVTGVLVLIFGMPAQWQLIAFAVLSVLSVIGWWQMRKARGQQPLTSTLNRRGHQYIGRTFTLDAPIENGVGKVSVDDSTWKVHGPDMPAGRQIKIVDVDGVVFVIEPVNG